MNQRVLQLQSADSKGSVVVYVMSRDQRVLDNYALLHAQKRANEADLPLVVLFALYAQSGHRSLEQYQFMIKGLKQVEADLQELNIGFMIMAGSAQDALEEFARTHEPEEIVFDMSPLKGPRRVQKAIAAKSSCIVSVVDAHNIIPLWVLSDKEEYAAHTIRSKVHKNLREWLIEPESASTHPIDPPELKFDWQELEKSLDGLVKTGTKYAFDSGEKAADVALNDFIKHRLNTYAADRNTPTTDGQSNLSPYLHFGQLSAQRIAYEVVKQAPDEPLLFREGKLASYEGEPTKMDSINAFLEELIVRRELADNYCFYNPNYDSLEGAKQWALDSLSAHASDPREYVYSKIEWEAAATHDDAWNAAQKQMMATGKMHGYMRMYWAKKILEWSESPAAAVKTAVYLNDKYSLDGGDPNGYTGILWSIAGIHDRPWFERPVYGKIRYMNASGLAKKFDVQEYIATWT